MCDEQDRRWMLEAIEMAQQAEAENEVPVGAIVVLDNTIIGRGYNRPISTHDPTAHAEIVALREAARNIDNYRLTNAVLYVTLEPCLMCTGAMVHARIDRLVYGAADPKSGVIDSRDRIHTATYLNHQIQATGGVLAEQCGEMLKRFFRARRQ